MLRHNLSHKLDEMNWNELFRGTFIFTVRADSSRRSFKRLIRFQFNYRKEMTRGHRSSTHEFERRMQNNFGRSFDGAPFSRPTRSVDPGAHEFLLKAAISLSPDKSWWVIRRHQSRCQRRLRRGPHRLPTHTHTCVHTQDIGRMGTRWTNFSGLFHRQTARCYVKPGEKDHGYATRSGPLALPRPIRIFNTAV